jgi:hypothetical protein
LKDVLITIQEKRAESNSRLADRFLITLFVVEIFHLDGFGNYGARRWRKIAQYHKKKKERNNATIENLDGNIVKAKTLDRGTLS